jgi:hypothetical protein
MKSMSGFQYVPTLNFFDVLHDGTLVGTVHLVRGGWCFYAAPRLRAGNGRECPTAVGVTRDAAVFAGLREE